MSRLQKKCIIGSTSVHLLLLLVLIVAPGFFSKDEVLDESQVLIIMPMMAADTDRPGGGNPQPRANPTPPQPAPPVNNPPQQPPEQPRVREETNEREMEREKPKPRDSNESFDPKPQKPHQVKVNREVKKIASAVRDNNAKAAAQEKREQDRAAAERAAVFRNAGRNISSGLSTSTQVDMPEGTGGGGVSYAPYAQIVRKVYTEAWTIPNDVTDDEATIKVSVTIARDGSVISSRIIKESGSRLVDRSIQNALDRVTTIGVPFPAGAKESQRTFTINFSLKAKKLLG
jgi:TonB family protein